MPSYMKTQSMLEEDLPYNFEKTPQKGNKPTKVGPIRPPQRLLGLETPGAQNKGDYGPAQQFTPLKSRNMPHTI